ncbi:hypothetical protein MXL46_09810 [Heyndrickxia sporothermodurans]|uniref:Uncharacterized protein n=1 Tax=Heyndrickxia sporothermodurans TaxID=46224 RepID=A0AB37HAH8_9BACI|nr:hypothetical protein [Heyndrickxia sporothermodurans]MBL5770332.1 hypothetical protein [Heyndrickxia sporothermodurans]MBL5773870.1 hypothetical protein [Heyndrickxia sporothermodurans]MBL5780823.1 hypothetical protein [Heyndrickxia sporothermodurans]MBL5797463.1 hypothetical protein [Heyndrickxia sporothermodurans]MBL5799681.1 hypothetical protein [Heyndrickxia sporothermodurans]
MKGNYKFAKNELVRISATNEQVTVVKAKYITNMKRNSYIVKEHPATFYFEEELEKL